MYRMSLIGAVMAMTSNLAVAASPHVFGTSPPSAPAISGDQFQTEADAKAKCGSDTVVWVNTSSHFYHFPGNSNYGHTKQGAYMCRGAADRSGIYHAAKGEKAPN